MRIGHQSHDLCRCRCTEEFSFFRCDVRRFYSLNRTLEAPLQLRKLLVPHDDGCSRIMTETHLNDSLSFYCPLKTCSSPVSFRICSWFPVSWIGRKHNLHLFLTFLKSLSSIHFTHVDINISIFVKSSFFLWEKLFLISSMKSDVVL